MKAAPLMEALKIRANLRLSLIYTGQHFDANMSKVFFEQLKMPEPDVILTFTEAPRLLKSDERFWLWIRHIPLSGRTW